MTISCFCQSFIFFGFNRLIKFMCFSSVLLSNCGCVLVSSVEKGSRRTKQRLATEPVFSSPMPDLKKIWCGDGRKASSGGGGGTEHEEEEERRRRREDRDARAWSKTANGGGGRR
ncbi:hypothetical protein Bca4012_079927 [Brassica carinata]|uniref:Uncharacterized protein n=1 Tax=Brassica carinata TaxID=52824 RepID=A0A8X7TEN6_BRACI|nr:hypothetical protein Bca52824_092461 [Brassica carinata]